MQFVFTDIEGSSRLWNEHGDAMPDVLRRHDALAIGLVEARGGRVVKHTGDGVFAVFEQGHALNFAADFQRSIAAELWDAVGGLHVRVGVAAGEAQRWADDFFGPPVNRAARLAEAAWGGQVVVTARALAEDPDLAGATIVDLGLHDFGDLGRPERVYQLSPPGQPHAEFPSLRSDLVHPHTLPSQPTLFVGRDSELADLLSMVRRPGLRLLTLTGPGGIGKTRLAIRLASALETEFEWGVYFVPLASASRGEHLVSNLAESLRFSLRAGLTPEDQLIDYIADKSLLLVLDNLEHMIEGLPWLVRLLTQCASIKLVVTSREHLLLQGEHVYEVRGMPYPGGAEDDRFEEYDAPRLFLEACRRCNRSFALSPSDKMALLRICRLTEGLPLALELAASWTRAMSVPAVADALESAPFALEHRLRDVPERHRSLGAAIRYSYELLSPAEQTAVRALSVFNGGFTVEAAREAVEVPLETLAALMDKSLARQVAPGRFDLHELTRRYARRLLDETADEAARQRDGHSRYYLRYLAARLPLVPGTEPGGAADISSEIANVRGAWERALERHDAGAIDSCCDALYRFCRVPGRDAEGYSLFASALTAMESMSIGAPDVEKTSAMVRIRLGHFQALACDYREARHSLRTGLHAARRLHLHAETALALQTIGRLWFMQGKLVWSQHAFEMSASWWRSARDSRSLAIVLASLGHVAAARGNHEAARSLHVEALAVAPRDISPRIGAYLNCNLGLVELQAGRLVEARRCLEAAMRQSLTDGDQALISHVGNALAEAYMVSKDYANTKSLLEESMRIRAQLGDKTYVVSTASRLAELANLQGSHQRAREWATIGIDGARTMGHEDLALECAVQAAWADLALDGPEVAQARIRIALREATARNEFKEQARALAVVAMICWVRGEHARAVELLASIKHAPPDHAVGQWVTDLLGQWRADLPDDYARSAEERGKSLDWRSLGEECT